MKSCLVTQTKHCIMNESNRVSWHVLIVLRRNNRHPIFPRIVNQLFVTEAQGAQIVISFLFFTFRFLFFTFPFLFFTFPFLFLTFWFSNPYFAFRLRFRFLFCTFPFSFLMFWFSFRHFAFRFFFRFLFIVFVCNFSIFTAISFYFSVFVFAFKLYNENQNLIINIKKQKTKTKKLKIKTKSKSKTKTDRVETIMLCWTINMEGQSVHPAECRFVDDVNPGKFSNQFTSIDCSKS